MTAYQGFRVTSTTMGVSPSPFEAFRTDYVYGGNKRDDDKERVSASPREYSAAKRQQRKDEYKAIVAEHPDWTFRQIALAMGLAPKTVRGFARELDPEGYQASCQAAVKREKMARFTAALAADPDPDRPNVAAASRAAGIPEATGYGYWKQLQDEQAASQEAAS